MDDDSVASESRFGDIGLLTVKSRVMYRVSAPCFGLSFCFGMHCREVK